jgi:pyridoxal phosphate enzyme (YggS family)
MAMKTIDANLAELRLRIRDIAVRAGRAPEDIRLVAVSKTRTLEEVEQAIAAGQRDFGENTMQDALTKIPALHATDAVWHFIGHLQSKKAKQIPGHFGWVHSVDSVKLAQKLSAAMSDSSLPQPLNCLIQVNVSKDPSKSGLDTEKVAPFIDQLLEQDLPCLNWRGLMTIGVQGDETRTRVAFAVLRGMLERCQQTFSLTHFDQLSMGMSNDYPIAIEEGSTIVRIGTAIFGERA